MEKERAESKAFEEAILKEIRANEEKSEHQKQVDERMMMIQKAYEEWVKANGGPKGKKGKRKPKK